MTGGQRKMRSGDAGAASWVGGGCCASIFVRHSIYVPDTRRKFDPPRVGLGGGFLPPVLFITRCSRSLTAEHRRRSHARCLRPIANPILPGGTGRALNFSALPSRAQAPLIKPSFGEPPADVSQRPSLSSLGHEQPCSERHLEPCSRNRGMSFPR